tara:strand:- start:1686 stop:1961 length:276 start_codon:yes stop_codon:yes gene_type:complete
MEKTYKFMKPTVILDRPRTAHDIKPEVYNILETKKNYLVYYPALVTSRLISYKPTSLGFEFETRNTIYICDWVPTLRMVSKEDFNKLRNSI